MKVRNIVLCGLFSALIAIGAFTKIPIVIPPFLVFPVTFQTLFVILAGLILGSKYGAISVAIYVLVGLMGLPVFTQGGGISYILNPTFGYLLSFILGAWFCGYIAEKFKPCFRTWFLAGVISIILIYALGIPAYYLVSRIYFDKILELRTILLVFILAPLPSDLFACFLAAIVVNRLKKFFPEEFTWKR